MASDAKHYPDSREGALDLLRDVTDLVEADLTTAAVRRDPVVPGCWLVRVGGVSFLVYVDDHALGPDFERVD